jgi:RsiW-degrading membrane proteinase PrsW (M82 family)
MENETGRNALIIPIHKPDLNEKLFFLLSGMILSIPLTLLLESSSAYFLGKNLPSSYAVFIVVAILGPMLEEFSKAYPLFYRHGETEKSLVSLGFYTGLGFGIVEFLTYVFFLDAPALIRFFALFFHATNTAIVAYGIARKKPAQMYLVAAVLHALNNFSALLGNPWFFIGLPAITISFLLFFILRFKAREKMISY